MTPRPQPRPWSPEALAVSFPWHRVFHPLCGADPLTLLGLLRRGPPGPAGLLPYAVALALSALRLPFTALEAALDALDRTDPAPPVFIVGHPRSGTTHLHNLMAATGAFATAAPVPATFPWEPRSVARAFRLVVDPFLPPTRLIDGVAMAPDAPTEDEVGLANLGGGSYFHALYWPRRFREDYVAGLLGPARDREVRRYVRALARGQARPLLLKNPAYTARVAGLPRLFPGARVVHIARDPVAVFASSRRAVRRALAALALQPWRDDEVDEAILAAYPPMMRSLREGAATLPPGRFAEVRFESLAADPAATLRRLWADLSLPQGSGAGVEAHLATVRGFRPEGARLPPEARARVERAWAAEIAAYPSAAPAG